MCRKCFSVLIGVSRDLVGRYFYFYGVYLFLIRMSVMREIIGDLFRLKG